MDDIIEEIPNAADRLAKIQSLLEEKSSDYVRNVLEEQDFYFSKIDCDDAGMGALTALNLLDTPFFTIEGIPAVPSTSTTGTTAGSGRRMSSNVSKTKRAVLAKYYAYAVGFGYWGDFDTAVKVEDDELLARATQRKHAKEGTNPWAYDIVDFLDSTKGVMLTKPGERKELPALEIEFNKPLQRFGYLFVVLDGDESDIEVTKPGQEDAFLFLDGKASTHLPRHTTDNPDCLWAELCIFGFATRIARTTTRDNEKENARQHLVDMLGLRKDKALKQQSDCEPSAMTLALLDNSQPDAPALTEVTRVATIIRKELHEYRIEESDAVNLWAGVMQACHYSVAKGRRMSIVLSSRMFWYVKLVVVEEEDVDLFGNRCRVMISDAHVVGSKGFMRKMVSFFIAAEEEESLLGKTDSRLWQQSLCARSDTGKGSASASGAGDGAGSRKRGRSPRNDQGKSSGNPNTPQASTTTTIANARSASDGEACTGDSDKNYGPTQTRMRGCQVLQRVSSAESHEEDEDGEPYWYQDKYGKVPWFDQIDRANSVVIGEGRVGKVTKVKWDGQDVALKTISLKHDDERSQDEVYKHELETITKLKDLWGMYVPELLFHKPWASGSLLGYQLGEPILEDDMSKWPDEDYKSARETISKVAEYGLVQEDERGINFVRLKGRDNVTRIAMVDFESLVETTTATSNRVLSD